MDRSSHRTGSQRTPVLEERARLSDHPLGRHTLRAGSRGQHTSPYRVVLLPTGRSDRPRVSQGIRLRPEERNGRGPGKDEDLHRKGTSATRCGQPDVVWSADDALWGIRFTTERWPAITSYRRALSRMTLRPACDSIVWAPHSGSAAALYLNFVHKF